MSLADEVKAERERPLIDDAPGYTRAQQTDLADLAYGHLSHRDMANMVRMLMRTDFLHEGIVVAARDRIAWLAGRVEKLEAALDVAEDFRLAARAHDAIPLGEATPEDGEDMDAIDQKLIAAIAACAE